MQSYTHEFILIVKHFNLTIPFNELIYLIISKVAGLTGL